ncbi:MAG: HupE/UreJ family protein [Bryobacteraceae bacterium]
MTRLACVLAAAPAWAHVMSMSHGDLLIEGARARFELRMPIYEIGHMQKPEVALLDALRFSSGGDAARLLTSACRPDPAQNVYLCNAEYEFPAPVGRLDVECRLHAVTVPNHVHLLRAVRDGKRDQAIFDASFSTAEIRFDPPTAFESAMRQTGAGAMRAVGAWMHVLFLAALALAARSRRELVLLGAAFLAGQIASTLIAPLAPWQPAPRFVEAAMALTIAYLAVEILALPRAGQRGLVAAVLGVFHGLYFAQFVASSDFAAAYVLAGAATAEAALVALFGLLLARLARPRLVQAAAALLLILGMVWFFIRLRA